MQNTGVFCSVSFIWNGKLPVRKIISLAFHNFPTFILSLYDQSVVETQDQIKSKVKIGSFLLTLPVSLLTSHFYFHSILLFTLSGLYWTVFHLNWSVSFCHISRRIPTTIYNCYLAMSWSCKLKEHKQRYLRQWLLIIFMLYINIGFENI